MGIAHAGAGFPAGSGGGEAASGGPHGAVSTGARAGGGGLGGGHAGGAGASNGGARGGAQEAQDPAASAASAAALRGAAAAPPSSGERRCRVVMSAAGALAELAAVERIFRQCTVESHRGSSKVNEQPVGSEEALLGATNRLEGAKRARPGADYYVSVESSLVEVPLPCGSEVERRYYDISWVVLERASGSRLRTAVPCCGVELIAEDVAQARARGFERKTAGAVTANRLGLLDGRDPHSWLTAGRRSRDALLGEAIAVALGQLERQGREQLAPKAPSAAQAAAKAAPASPPTTLRRKWLGGSAAE